MRRVVIKAGGRKPAAGGSTPEGATVTLDDRPLSLTPSRDGKRVLVALPYEVWVVNTDSLEVENTIVLPVAHPTVYEAEHEGVLWIGGQQLHRGSLFSATATKVGTKLGGFVDHVCLLRTRLLCGVGTHGEILWDHAQEADVHRRKIGEHHVYGLVASPDGRAVWTDGSPHAWVIDPEHASGYMKLKLRTTSPGDESQEGIVALGSTSDGRTLLGARDGAIGWTNRALRLVDERFPRFEGKTTPLALTGDARHAYVLRPGGVLQRFLVAAPEPVEGKPGGKDRERDKEEPLPEAQTVRLSRVATCIVITSDGKLLLAGPQHDDQLGRLWREDTEALGWEPLRLGKRTLVPAPPPAPPGEAEAPRRPDFTPVRSKLSGLPIAEIKVDDVLAGVTEFWVTRPQGSVLERPTGILPEAEVLGGDALLLPAMFRLQQGTARPGLVLWPGVPDERPLLPITWLTWGDDPRAWLPLETPAIRKQGWSRREVFPLQVALAHPPPQVAGRRSKLPSKWSDRELFDALVRECKKLLQVLW